MQPVKDLLHPSSGQAPPVDQASSSLFGDSTISGAYRAPPEPDTLDIDPPLSEASYSEDQVSDEGEISSDTLERPEQLGPSGRSWGGIIFPRLKVTSVSPIK